MLDEFKEETILTYLIVMQSLLGQASLPNNNVQRRNNTNIPDYQAFSTGTSKST